MDSDSSHNLSVRRTHGGSAMLSLLADDEGKIAASRLLLAGLLMIGAIAGLFDARSPALWISATTASLVYAGLALLICMPAARRTPASGRRSLMLLFDVSMLSYVLAIGGEYGVLVAPAYVWIILANSQFGRGQLAGASWLSLTGFLVAAYSSIYLSQHPGMIVSLALTLTMAALFVAVMAARFRAAIKAGDTPAGEQQAKLVRELQARLRTALDGVCSINELMRLQTRLSSEQRELNQAIHESAERSRAILAASIGEASEPETNAQDPVIEFDLRRLVHEIQHAYAPIARQQGLCLRADFSPQTPPLLRGDAQRLRHLLVNLTRNACSACSAQTLELRVMPCGDDFRDAGLRIRIEAHISPTRDAQPPAAEELVDESARELIGRLGAVLEFAPAGPGSADLAIEFPLHRSLASHAMPKPPILPGVRVLLIASTATADAIEATLAGWAVPFDRATSATQLSARLHAAVRQDYDYTAVLLERSVLEEKPERIAADLLSNSRFSPPSLILLSEVGSVDVAASLQAGFSSVLRLPLDTSLLFNALSAARGPQPIAANVVSLASHVHARERKDRLSILLVENSAKHRLELLKQLRQAGHKAVALDNAESALDLFGQNCDRYDLVMLDLALPDRSGAEFIKALRFIEHGPHRVATLLMTDTPSLESDQACAEAGADGLLSKPVDPRRLAETFAYIKQAQTPVATSTSGAQVKTATLIVNESKLEDLARLGAGIEFVRELIDGFERDGERLLVALEAAVRSANYRQYRDTLHAFRGSAMELGCQFLAAQCQIAGQLKPFEISGNKPAAGYTEVSLAYSRTCTILRDYVDRQRDAR